MQLKGLIEMKQLNKRLPEWSHPLHIGFLLLSLSLVPSFREHKDGSLAPDKEGLS